MGARNWRRFVLIVALLPTSGHTEEPPPPAKPAEEAPAVEKVPPPMPRAKVADSLAALDDSPPEPADLEPVPVITGPTAAIAGTLVKVTAHGSRNAKGFAWLVTPDVGAEISADGRTCIFASPRPGTYTFVLAVSTPGGKVAMTSSRIVLRGAIEEEEPEAGAGPVKAFAAGAPEEKKFLAAVVAACKGVDKTTLSRVGTGLGKVADLCFERRIEGIEEYDRAIAFATGGLSGIGGLMDAVDDAVDALAGEDENWLRVHDALKRVADVVNSKAK